VKIGEGVLDIENKVNPPSKVTCYSEELKENCISKNKKEHTCAFTQSSSA